jgi:hypothetical protein
MKRVTLLLVLLSVMGCGSVEDRRDDAGTGGGAGQLDTDAGGAGGVAVDAGVDRGATGGAGGQQVDASIDAGCIPTSCTTCVSGVATPIADGTQCGGGLCDGVPNFYGQHACTTTNYVCMSGACTTMTVNCCTQLGCTSGQYACTGVSGLASTAPTYCAPTCG